MHKVALVSYYLGSDAEIAEQKLLSMIALKKLAKHGTGGLTMGTNFYFFTQNKEQKPLFGSKAELVDEPVVSFLENTGVDNEPIPKKSV